MLSWTKRRFAARGRRALLHKEQALLAVVAVAVSFYVIAYPFMVVTYPPITDLPFHATFASILRHYFDPAFHFRDQFSFHPFDSPYISMYVVGAFFACFLPMVTATKVMSVAMLALLPIGLGVMFHGMKKSPLLGLLGLAPVWSTLTHWGFLNFIGAVGLFAMVIGLTLLALDRPTRAHVVGLGVSLLAVFFTHIYRFPFALAAVAGTTIVMYPATRRIRPVLGPLALAVAVFGVWTAFKRKTMSGDLGPLAFHWERVQEIRASTFNGFLGAEEQKLVEQMLWVLVGVWVVAFVASLVTWWRRRHGARQTWWVVGVTLLPLLACAAYLGCFFVLPMSIGIWWYVYPREIVTAFYMALGFFPDLPRAFWLRAPLIAAIALATGRLAHYVAQQWHDFEPATADFKAIQRYVPPAPKLMYLVFDHSGSSRSNTPFIHFPAWIQAEKGGWLSFHQVGSDVLPFRYREEDPNRPPPRPLRWEWTPERFDLRRDGPWADTFLVRSSSVPDHLFAGDPSIVLARHEGTWWLYVRRL
jgi:hypothetical protein